jgi:precorrin-2 dehydrogenase/sirohydrochlorin ferrochelatase
LLDFSLNISIIAPNTNDDIQKLINTHDLTHEQKSYETHDIAGFDIVVVAVDDIPLQKSIYNEAKNHNNCLVNCVDSAKFCDFIFPSYIKKDNLTIAISTAGASPAFAKRFRAYLGKLVPDDIDEFLKKMRSYRKTMPKGDSRMQFLDKKAKEYIDEI